jgi:hypothetical protein
MSRGPAGALGFIDTTSNFGFCAVCATLSAAMPLTAIPSSNAKPILLIAVLHEEYWSRV